MATLPGPPVRAQSDEALKQAIIQESIAGYPGNCPCPYNTMRNGARCGGRSAYSRPGGYAPLCYPGDVTPEMLAQYKKAQARKAPAKAG
ncbi:hypothetical protein HHL28_13735 [Aerophototrophica crusticola]|uniref:Uncharacterized protein n=1 Tax=Aerophototrophica crusticola TaxID=1709002 RepID=A0A858RBV5_9PROT|nr:hypothetical protein HHL28_13735 [Rhodospirillaceae bacterium B3]